MAAAEVVTTDGAEGGEAAWVWENQRGEEDDDGPAMALELGGLRGPVDEAVDMFALKRATLGINRLDLRLFAPRHWLLLTAFNVYRCNTAQHSDLDVLLCGVTPFPYTLVYWANGFGVRRERRGKDRLEPWTSNHTHFFIRHRSNPKSV